MATLCQAENIFSARVKNECQFLNVCLSLCKFCRYFKMLREGAKLVFSERADVYIYIYMYAI